jgi:hypothetical protein
MPLNSETRLAISDYLFRVVSAIVEQKKKIRKKKSPEKPFHDRLFPILLEARFSERSFSTSSGSWFQQIARLVALQFHAEAQVNFRVKGRLQPAAAALIEAITEAMDKGTPKRKPDRERDCREVLTVQWSGGTDRSVISDLFIRRNDNSELYFEMKTPTPNKEQCKKMKQHMLLITALKKDFPAIAFAGAAYNPYGDNQPYRNSAARQFMEIGKDFLIGREFWSVIGDDKTYDELLEISSAVGERIKPLLEL